MPKSRPPRDVWVALRRIVLRRQGLRCGRCGVAVHDGQPRDATQAHVDHRRSGKRAGNRLRELRVLCFRCHVLRADLRHQGMIAEAVNLGVIPPDWRPLVWDD